MTIPQRLDDIKFAHHDCEKAAIRLAASLAKDELLALMLAPVLAEAGTVVRLDRIANVEAQLAIGAAQHRAHVAIGEPGKDALVVLQDLGIALVSTDQLLHALWPYTLRIATPALLRALQYARDDADDLLYRPSAERYAELTKWAAQWGLPAELLRALAVNRRAFSSAAQPVGH